VKDIHVRATDVYTAEDLEDMFDMSEEQVAAALVLLARTIYNAEVRATGCTHHKSYDPLTIYTEDGQLHAATYVFSVNRGFAASSLEEIRKYLEDYLVESMCANDDS